MSSKQERARVAVLDDYQHVALSLADWSVLDARATVTVFDDHLADTDAVVARLQPFDIVCVMRERTPMTRTIIERLPKLRMIASTGTRNASIDLKAAEEPREAPRGVVRRAQETRNRIQEEHLSEPI